LALDFGDTLRFELTENNGSCDIFMLWQNIAPPLPLEKNIVYKAISVFRKQTGFNKGIKVIVKKQIPFGAGLGGGSSNAASTLKALNILADTALSLEVLRDMAEKLGSDVPFFLYDKGAAWVSGRGEKIMPIKIPEGLIVLLVFPNLSSSTKEAFNLLDKFRPYKKNILAESTQETLINLLNEHPSTWLYENDFLPLFLKYGKMEEREAYYNILMDLKSAGADFAGLSGSGSTCFGIFTNREMAEKAVVRQKNAVQVTMPLRIFR